MFIFSTGFFLFGCCRTVKVFVVLDEIHNESISHNLVDRIRTMEYIETAHEDLLPIFASNEPDDLAHDQSDAQKELHGEDVGGIAEQSIESGVRFRLRMSSVAEMLNGEKVLLVIGREFHHAAARVGVAFG